MAYYPVMLDIQDQNCLVIGGGKVAVRKVNSILDCDGKVTVISKKVCYELEELQRDGKINIIKRGYKKGDVKDFFLAIAASSDMKVNEQVAMEAEENKVLVNVVDVKENSRFIVPSVVRKGDLTISIATGGKSPLLSRLLREKFESIFDDDCAKLLDKLGKVRDDLKAQDLTLDEKIRIYGSIIEKSGILNF